MSKAKKRVITNIGGLRIGDEGAVMAAARNMGIEGLLEDLSEFEKSPQSMALALWRGLCDAMPENDAHKLLIAELNEWINEGVFIVRRKA